MAIPRNGRYVVKAELAAFATETKEVLINAAGQNGGKPEQVAEFGMQLASRVTQQEAAGGDGRLGRRPAHGRRWGAGLQALSVTRRWPGCDGCKRRRNRQCGSADAYAERDWVAAMRSATDSVTVSGQWDRRMGWRTSAKTIFGNGCRTRCSRHSGRVALLAIWRTCRGGDAGRI